MQAKILVIALKPVIRAIKYILDGTVELFHFLPKQSYVKPWTFYKDIFQYRPFLYEDTNDQNEKETDYCPKETKNKLRIGLLSTQFFGIPPPGYSGLEQVVWDLADALDALGHEVTFFAPTGSQAPRNGKLVETGDPLSIVHTDWVQAERNAYKI